MSDSLLRKFEDTGRYVSKKLLILVTYSTESLEVIDKRSRKSRPIGEDFSQLAMSSIVSPLESLLATSEPPNC